VSEAYGRYGSTGQNGGPLEPLPRSVDGNRDGDRRAFAGFGVDPDVAAVALDDAPTAVPDLQSISR